MALMIFFPILLFLASVSQAVGIPHGETVPNFSLTSVNGEVITLDRYRGAIVILLYWRTEQERSLMALKDSQDIFSRYINKRVQVVSITPGIDERDELIKLIKENDIKFPVLIDTERQVFGDYGIRVYPSTLIVDGNSRLSYDIPGHSPAYKTVLEAHLQFLLGEIDEKKMLDLLTFRKEVPNESLAIAKRRYNLALKFTQTQLYDQAIYAAKKSIEAKPDLAKPHMLLGFLYLEMNENDMAYEEFHKAVVIDPLLRDAKTGLGATLIAKGELDRAVETLQDAAESNPCPIRTYYELGRAYELKGEKDNSIEMYKKALGEIVREHIVPSSISEEYR